MVRTRAMPFDVALARPIEQVPAPGVLEGGCRYEPKWDGYRALVVVEGNGAHTLSRRGTDPSATFPEIVLALEEQVEDGTVLDGELVIWQDGRLAFDALRSGWAADRAQRPPQPAGAQRPSSRSTCSVSSTGTYGPRRSTTGVSCSSNSRSPGGRH